MEIKKSKNQFMSLNDLLKNVESYSSKVFKNQTKCLNLLNQKKKENVGVFYGFGILVMTISKIGMHFDEKRLGL